MGTHNFTPSNYATTNEINNIYDQLGAKANTRLSNVVSNLSDVEKNAFKNKFSITDTTYSTFSITNSGLVPASQEVTGRFLADDGTWKQMTSRVKKYWSGAFNSGASIDVTSYDVSAVLINTPSVISMRVGTGGTDGSVLVINVADAAAGSRVNFDRVIVYSDVPIGYINISKGVSLRLSWSQERDSWFLESKTTFVP